MLIVYVYWNLQGRIWRSYVFKVVILHQFNIQISYYLCWKKMLKKIHYFAVGCLHMFLSCNFCFLVLSVLYVMSAWYNFSLSARPPPATKYHNMGITHKNFDYTSKNVSALICWKYHVRYKHHLFIPLPDAAWTSSIFNILRFSNLSII